MATVEFTALPGTDPELFARFMAKVETGAGCWGWDAAKTKFGYGQLRVARHCVPAHRLSWTFFRGPIPAGLCVLHRCDNPPCCRPDHLFLGTKADNTADMISKGRRRGGGPSGEKSWSRNNPDRLARGERCGAARLTEGDVQTIRHLYDGGATLAEVGARFGVNLGTIWCIIHRKTWAHVV